MFSRKILVALINTQLASYLAIWTIYYIHVAHAVASVYEYTYLATDAIAFDV